MPPLESRDVGIEGRGLRLVIVTVVFTLAALTAIIIRFVCRHSRYGKEDWTIAFSMLCSVLLGIFTCFSVDHGVGKHISALPHDDVKAALIAFFTSQTLYKLSIDATKFSFLFLYLRIFPANQENRHFRISCYIVMAYILLYTIASIIVTIFQCTPVGRYFNHSIEGSCINVEVFWYSNAINNIVGNILTLSLPVRKIHKLQITKSDKVGLYTCFGLGTFVCAISIIRIRTLSPGSKNPDTTYGTLDSTLWSIVEVNAAILCACGPFLKKPILLLWKNCRARSQQSSSSPSNNGHGGRGHRQRNCWRRRGRLGDSWCGRKARMLMRRGNGSGDGGEEEEGEGETERLAMGQICKRTDVRVLRSERDGGMGGDDGCLGGEWNRKGAGGVEGGEVVMFPGIVHLT